MYSVSSSIHLGLGFLGREGAKLTCSNTWDSKVLDVVPWGVGLQLGLGVHIWSGHSLPTELLVA